MVEAKCLGLERDGFTELPVDFRCIHRIYDDHRDGEEGVLQKEEVLENKGACGIQPAAFKQSFTD